MRCIGHNVNNMLLLQLQIMPVLISALSDYKLNVLVGV